MKFIRVDEETVRCIVTEEDMKEHGVEIDDFLSNKGNVHEFLHSIVEQAVEEVGYEAKNGVLSMQVVPLPKNSLAITFSEKEDNGIQDMLAQIKDVVGDVGDILNKDMLTAMGEQFMNDKVKEESEENEEILERKKEKAPKKKDSSNKPKIAIFRFNSLDDIEKLSKANPFDKPIHSSVFKNELNGIYYCIIETGRLSFKNFGELCKLANEFGYYEGSSAMRAAYIVEHETCLIKKKALNVLREL